MRIFILVLGIAVLFIECNSKRTHNKVVIKEYFNCQTGAMQQAWYEHGIEEPIPNISGLKGEFTILVDTNFKAKNFISSFEDYCRRESLVESDFDWMDNWKELSKREKQKIIVERRKSMIAKADSFHLVNNQGQQQVWIINNSKDTVTIQMQDWSYVCILQAKTKNGRWLPIEYWEFSDCGNSSYHRPIMPKMANSFITQLPNRGNYKTKLRYKLLTKGKYYYSNEFNGKINYCEFVEDISDYVEKGEKPYLHFKLDSLIDLRRM